MSLPRVHLVLGTRPEAIKLAPLAVALRNGGIVEPVIVATGQHGVPVDQALAAFGLTPDVRLDLARTTGSQPELVAQVTTQLDPVLADSAAVVVQGDTTTALVGGLVAMWRRIPVVHLEAGLRSGDLSAPFPEEANRRMLSVFADLHLAPTRRAVEALAREGLDGDRVLLTGNTVVDAVVATAKAAAGSTPTDPRVGELLREVEAGRGRLLLVTAHRRESWGEPLDRVMDAVRQVVDDHPDLLCVVPTHPNPAVRAQVEAVLAGHPRIHTTGPLAYPELCRVLSLSTLVLTDSGGIQEEAPSFGVPTVVLRDVTERVEAVESGWAVLVGTDPESISVAAKRFLDGDFTPPTRTNPFGDGLAAERGAQAIAWLLDKAERPEPFAP
ncbi:non-hydrolyzing UDP-N-acetylglucosamine 2-epimerase [Pseudonocardia pini]|uniref:non-hydrolyzing UDP-N-acetylglucosamine 2-epimerase n=1 Tax=Pseudonocardia pini TaxID=2758030 RepID=UPI0015F06355|nr:UDP-N-acetylglucosamine 2-epimerase (non-hydrolyzing) [Pseudonocardia pini]